MINECSSVESIERKQKAQAIEIENKKSIYYWEYKLVRSIPKAILKDDSSCCEWFIVTADFGGFREDKHLQIIFSLYRFEFHTKILIFTVFEMSNFVLTKQRRF